MPQKPNPIPIETLARIKADLSRLSAKPKASVTRHEAVRHLENDIRHAIDLGHSLADIAAIFTAAGAPVRPDTIGNALRGLRPKPAANTGKTKPALQPAPKAAPQTSPAVTPDPEPPRMMNKIGQPVHVKPARDGGTDGTRG